MSLSNKQSFNNLKHDKSSIFKDPQCDCAWRLVYVGSHETRPVFERSSSFSLERPLSIHFIARIKASVTFLCRKLTPPAPAADTFICFVVWFRWACYFLHDATMPHPRTTDFALLLLLQCMHRFCQQARSFVFYYECCNWRRP